MIKLVLGFKATVKDINEFIDNIKLAGTDEMGKKSCLYDDAILYIVKGGIKTEMVDEHRISYQRVKWIADNLDDFKKLEILDEEGSIPISSLDKFGSILKSFKPTDEVTVKVVKNKLFIERKNPRKRGSFALVDSEYIKSRDVGDNDKFKFDPAADDRPTIIDNVLDVKINVNSDDLKQVIIDGNKVDDRSYPIKISPDSFFIKVGNDEFFIESEIPAKIEMEGELAESLYRAGMGNIVGNVSGMIDLYMKDNGFLWITNIDQNIRKDYMVTNAKLNE